MSDIFKKGDRVNVDYPCNGRIRKATVLLVSSNTYKVLYDDAAPHEINCWIAEKWLSKLPEDKRGRLKALTTLDHTSGQ